MTEPTTPAGREALAVIGGLREQCHPSAGATYHDAIAILAIEQQAVSAWLASEEGVAMVAEMLRRHATLTEHEMRDDGMGLARALCDALLKEMETR